VKVTVDTIGMDGFFKDLDAGMRRATGRAAAALEAEIKTSFGASGAGGGPVGRVTNIPSAPGSPPSVQTGRLRNSIGYNVVGPARAQVGTNVEYGLYLEFGTSRMPARPFLRPIVNSRKAMGAARDAAVAELRRSIASAKASAMGGAR